MPLISFLIRRFVTGALARRATQLLSRRLKLSSGVTNIAFVILTEVLAQFAERIGRGRGGSGKGGSSGKRA